LHFFGLRVKGRNYETNRYHHFLQVLMKNPLTCSARLRGKCVDTPTKGPLKFRGLIESVYDWEFFLLGDRAMACDFFPYPVLSNKSIGAKDGLNAVFATDHSIIGIGIGRNRSVIVIDADF
jgi:hypothetical protein